MTPNKTSNRLREIYNFLNTNRQYNHAWQTKYYKSICRPELNTQEKVLSLMWHTAQTQSQLKLDKFKIFNEKVHANKKQLNSFAGLVRLLSNGNIIEANYKGLYEGLRSQPSWGGKTAALFTKAIYQMHNGEYDSGIRIWKDAPKCLTKDDILFLPVDAVIIYIFEQIEPRKWTFPKVHKQLRQDYEGTEIEVWDDLWFWGYITQHGGGKERKTEWNPAKYWSAYWSDKTPQMIKEIDNKAAEFIAILKSR